MYTCSCVLCFVCVTTYTNKYCFCGNEGEAMEGHLLTREESGFGLAGC